MINLTAGLGGGRTNSSRFYSGLFTILQKRARNAFMTLRLDGGNFRVCGRSSLTTLGTGAKRKRPVRKLWGTARPVHDEGAVQLGDRPRDEWWCRIEATRR